ncbi:MAG: PaaI family thioesterase [Gemmataceae bacterium]
MLEMAQQMVRGEREPFAVAKLLGMRMTAAEVGKVSFCLTVDERFHNPMGTLHGGIYTDLADAAMGWAYATTLGEGESFTTIELKINFLRAVRSDTLTASANVVKQGSTLGYVECDVMDSQGRLVAKAASTCLKLKSS